MTDQRIQQEAICYQWFKQRLILSVSEPSNSQRSQIKEDTVEHSVPARGFNLKAYAAITWHNDPASLGLEPRLADHRSQAARTATLSTAPPRQGTHQGHFGMKSTVAKFTITIRLELYAQLQLFSFSNNQPLYHLQRERFVQPLLQSGTLLVSTSVQLIHF